MPLGLLTCVSRTHFKEELDILIIYSDIRKNDVISAIYLHFIWNARSKSIRSLPRHLKRPNYQRCRNIRTTFSIALQSSLIHTGCIYDLVYKGFENEMGDEIWCVTPPPPPPFTLLFFSSPCIIFFISKIIYKKK